MSYIKHYNILILTFLSFTLFAQTTQKYEDYPETKIFYKDKHAIVMSNYLDNDGLPSKDEFLIKHGLYPTNKVSKIIPYFSFSVSKKFIKNEGKPSLDPNAKLFNLDFFVEKNATHESKNRADIVWDGRVYSEENDLIVGGYSSKYNEQPVGKINEIGEFIQLLNGEKAKEFLILQLTNQQVIFDPFDWTLVKITPTEGKKVQKTQREFLPIDLKLKNGSMLNDVEYFFEQVIETSELKLFASLNGDKIEIASCNLVNYSEVKSKEAFRPELIEGCTQLGEEDVITLFFKAKFSKNVAIINSELYLDEKESKKDSGPVGKAVLVDGDFNEWRNIKGLSDYEGDYVSYLFENPDSDLLEFKITNDDKYLYLYSRVAGAHGRTGENGRYYWYAYIDVDADPYTGYPPTRDDNCYFGIAIGDDSEAQFEFIDNKFVKTFFGFTGIGAEQEVLSGKLELGPSYYSSTDKSGNKRDKYKIEYVNREGSRFITHDYTEGTSEDIIIALSPDGSEVEMKVELDGFLQDKNGYKLLEQGSKIDIAIGAESSSNHYGADEWGADSSPVIFGYVIK